MCINLWKNYFWFSSRPRAQTSSKILRSSDKCNRLSWANARPKVSAKPLSTRRHLISSSVLMILFLMATEKVSPLLRSIPTLRWTLQTRRYIANSRWSKSRKWENTPRSSKERSPKRISTLILRKTGCRLSPVPTTITNQRLVLQRLKLEPPESERQSNWEIMRTKSQKTLSNKWFKNRKWRVPRKRHQRRVCNWENLRWRKTTSWRS